MLSDSESRSIMPADSTPSGKRPAGELLDESDQTPAPIAETVPAKLLDDSETPAPISGKRFAGQLQDAKDAPAPVSGKRLAGQLQDAKDTPAPGPVRKAQKKDPATVLLQKLGKKVASKIKNTGYKSDKQLVFKFDETIESKEFGENLFDDTDAEEKIGARVSKFVLAGEDACHWLRLDETQPDSSGRRPGSHKPDPYFLSGTRFFRECKWYGKSVGFIGAPYRGPLKSDVEVKKLEASLTKDKMTVTVTVKNTDCLMLSKLFLR